MTRLKRLSFFYEKQMERAKEQRRVVISNSVKSLGHSLWDQMRLLLGKSFSNCAMRSLADSVAEIGQKTENDH